MNIRPSAAIRQNYNEIADLCRKTAEPIFLTKNGEGDLVVMDIETYNRREKMLKLREELLSVEEDRLRGSEGYSVGEVTSMMRSAIREQSAMEQQNKKYRVVVSARAAQMLVSHAAFLAQASTAAAQRLTAEFEKAANSLEFMPQRCPWLTGDYIPRNTYRFILFEKRYMLIFQIMESTVYADYVVDCRQDCDWLLRR